jgi:MFS family permease
VQGVRRDLSPALAAGLVFLASGAVLVLEILGIRLLAPYVGVTLETYTTIIGVVLGGIAAGAALGGRAADRSDPARLLPALLVGGGVLALATVPLVRALGEVAEGTGDFGAMVVALLALLPPAAVLSAVTPVVVKLQLEDLAESGSVVGRLSAWATAGALTGTFGTGFVLVPLLPTRITVLLVGAVLIFAGVVAGARLRAAAAAGAAALALLGVAAGSPCQTETVYYCAQVQADPAREGGRVLVLDDLRHAYVDLDEPRYLDFAYVRWLPAAIAAQRPPGAALDAVFVGGGGFTLPRWLAAARPGSRATVLEVDEQVVDLARERLGLRTGPGLRVRVGDARVTLRQEPDESADVVVGDAFGGRSIPWHLATREFLGDVRRVLRPRGLYALNLIDRGPLDLARAEAATLLDSFGEVALVARATAGDDPAGGNLVLLASDAPLPALRPPDGARVWRGRAVEAFAGDGDPLRDDDAPADQLLTPR